jgi:hypothetical protein
MLKFLKGLPLVLRSFAGGKEGQAAAPRKLSLEDFQGDGQSWPAKVMMSGRLSSCSSWQEFRFQTREGSR